MIQLSSLVQRQKSSFTVLLATSLFYSGFLIAAPVKVAFTGDQGAGDDARAVLSLIASEGADLLLLQGDLGYDDGKASTWEENMTQALGADFPVLTVVGNHENYEWPLYKQYIQQRIDRADGLSCSGDTGVKALCRYKNIEIVQVSPGINEVEGVNGQDNYADFIKSSFAESTAPWRICAWHKNQSKMQTGRKSDATGWDVYDSCLDAGAMIALAHEHAYSRTYLLSDFRNQQVSHKNSEMTLEPGRSFAFVSGLGGREVREQLQGGDWWASIYTANQGATHGALFCTFEETTADCYFKAIDGAVPDQFTLKTRQGSESDSSTTAPVIAEAQPVVVETTVVAQSTQETVAEVAATAETEAAADTEIAVAATAETEVAAETEVTAVTEAEAEVTAATEAEAEVTAATEAEAFSLSETDSIADESTDIGPLTVTSSSDVAGNNVLPPPPVERETEVSAERNDIGGSASSDVGAGSISLFLVLVMMARIRLRGFSGFAGRANRIS